MANGTPYRMTMILPDRPVSKFPQKEGCTGNRLLAREIDLSPHEVATEVGISFLARRFYLETPGFASHFPVSAPCPLGRR